MRSTSIALISILSLWIFSDAQASLFTPPATHKAWEKVLAQFKPVSLTADTSSLSEKDKQALQKIVQASELIHGAYLQQVWVGSHEMKTRLEKSNAPLAAMELRFFEQNSGPWSGLNGDAPFISGAGKKPEGGGFYPENMKKAEFETWVKGLDEAQQTAAKGCFTVVARDGKSLKLVPYHEAYAKWVEPASKLLKEASELSSNASLKKYLSLISTSLLTDEYFASDVAWLGLDSAIDVTFGPYETYDDKLFGYKASYESFVGIVDAAESKSLATIADQLQFLENSLPIPDKYKNASLGKVSPIKIINIVYTAGDARGGVMTAAFNLPNDEKVLNQHGSKKVMLKNVQQAKFDHILKPLAGLAVTPKESKYLDFEAFFTHILAHELSHGLGPHEIQKDGKTTTVRQELKEQYSALEEAKADILGLFALEKLLEKGVVSASLKRTLHSTYLASAFRSVRFGVDEAHGKGTALQFNYLWDKGAIEYDKKSGKFSIVDANFSEGVRALTSEILLIQAEGSYEKAKALLVKYARVRPEMKRILDKAKILPVDIEPKYAFPAPTT